MIRLGIVLVTAAVFCNSCSPTAQTNSSAVWLDHVPDMLQPVVKEPDRGRPVMAKPLSERTEQYDAIILGTKTHTRAYEAESKSFVGIVGIRVEEVLKGEAVTTELILEVARYKWHDRSSVERTLQMDLEDRLKRGIVGLKALPEGSPVRYLWEWFTVPGGDNWEPILQAFREDVRREETDQP